ncbi:hypothetical protein BH23GEM10_BH23GEM10_14460 [soil metagenome]
MIRILTVLPLVVVLAACGDADSDHSLNADSAYTVETPEAAAELMAPVRAVSMAVLEFGDDAARRPVGGDVRQYATVAATDHRGLIEALDSEAAKRGAGITQTPAAQELENSVRLAHAGLTAMEGPDFELAFIRAQVEAHRQLLDRLELDLLPAATSRQMQQLLQDVRATEEAHLTRARQILASLLGESAEPTAPPAGSTSPTTTTTPPPIPPDSIY